MKAENNKVSVHFEPDNIDVSVEPGTSLLEAAINAGIYIAASCGGQGHCGTCKVLIKEGSVEGARTDKVSAEEYNQGFRQACRSKVLSDLAVYIPVESRLEKTALVREDEEIGDVAVSGWGFGFPSTLPSLEIPPATLEEATIELPRSRPPLTEPGVSRSPAGGDAWRCG